jgi:hypothetical protein
MASWKSIAYVLDGSSLGSSWRIASGGCWPGGADTRVYGRWNPFGPAILNSQLSFSREPMIETLHSRADRSA